MFSLPHSHLYLVPLKCGCSDDQERGKAGEEICKYQGSTLVPPEATKNPSHIQSYTAIIERKII